MVTHKELSKGDVDNFAPSPIRRKTQNFYVGICKSFKTHLLKSDENQVIGHA